MRKLLYILGAMALVLSACTQKQPSACDLPLVPALEDAAWEASDWISVVDAPIAKGPDQDNYCSAPGANWFLSVVQNEKKVKKAVWMTAGLGVYDLFVNGELVGKEVLKPGFTHYAKTKRSFTYDITPILDKKAGAQNQLSAQVTPGWWADKIITPGGDSMFGKKCAFRGVLELTYADGSKQLLGTDTEHWTAGIAGPVKHAGIFDGEEYDAREPMGYETPELLKKPEINTEFQGEILPDNGAEIYQREDLTLRPVEIYVWEGVTGAVESEKEEEVEYGKVVIKRSFKDGDLVDLNPGETLVVDFGQNAAAAPSFVFKAAEGTKLVCYPSEILNDGNGAEKRGMDGPEGSTHRRNLRVDPGEIWLTYTFGPADDFVSFTPRCSFWGYRYIAVTADAPVQFQSLASIPVTSISHPMEIGTLKTGNEDINRLISNTVWGMRSNYLSVPTDCPQRNERLGWMADTQVFTETGTFFANTSRFFHKWTRDIRDSQDPVTGGYPGVAPYAQYGNEKMRLGWADAGIIVPWTVWKQFGDKEIVDENWESMEKFMDHINATKYDHAALRAENGNYNWADWLSYEALESCSGRAFKDAATRKQAEEYWSFLGGCYWLLDAQMMAQMALNTDRDASKYQDMSFEAWEYLRDRFLNVDGTFKLDILNTMQTPTLFGLKLNLFTEGAAEVATERLRKNFQEHGNCLQTGFLGTSILLPTLTESGMADIAYELLFQRKNPSWLYSVDNGATTIWERWNSYMKDSGMGPSGMNSFNHYAYGCVCQWLFEYAAGIETSVNMPGFECLYLHPVPDKRLGWLEAEYETPCGVVKSAWKYEGDTCIWTFTIPEGVKEAYVTLPGEYEDKRYDPGTYTLEI